MVIKFDLFTIKQENKLQVSVMQQESAPKV
jgi:hypothetical protein